MNYSELEDLWVANGGNSSTRNMAAAIAMAESGGNPNAKLVNTNGSIDRGLWQINSVHGTLSTFDPNDNCQAAISLSLNGANWRPWCTAYSDGACGTKGGTYLGNGAPYQRYIQPLPIPKPIFGDETMTLIRNETTGQIAITDGVRRRDITTPPEVDYWINTKGLKQDDIPAPWYTSIPHV